MRAGGPGEDHDPQAAVAAGVRLPRLASRPITQITPHEVCEVPRTVEARGYYETARRLRGTCGQVFRYAVATGRGERDVCADLRGP
jgi:hypothetical protein